MKKQKWIIDVDRFNGSNKKFSFIRTAKKIVSEYKKQEVQPEIYVNTIGIGAGIADYMEERGIAVNKIILLYNAMGNAYIYKIV